MGEIGFSASNVSLVPAIRVVLTALHRCLLRRRDHSTLDGADRIVIPVIDASLPGVVVSRGVICVCVHLVVLVWVPIGVSCDIWVLPLPRAKSGHGACWIVWGSPSPCGPPSHVALFHGMVANHAQLLRLHLSAGLLPGSVCLTLLPQGVAAVIPKAPITGYIAAKGVAPVLQSRPIAGAYTCRGHHVSTLRQHFEIARSVYRVPETWSIFCGAHAYAAGAAFPI